MSFIGKNNLEGGFEGGENEEEIRKYGFLKKGENFKNKIFNLIIVFAFLFFFASVYLLYLVKNLKKELKSVNATQKSLKYKLKEITNQLDEQKERIDYLNEIEEDFPFIKREKGDKVKVIDNVMNYDKTQYAIKIAKEAYYNNKTEKGIATYISTKFDLKYKKYWQCIVGLSYNYYITCNSDEFIYFSLGQFDILLFRNDIK